MAALKANTGKDLEGWQLRELANLKSIGALNAANAAAIGVNAAQFAKYQTEQAEATAKLKKEQAEAEAAAKKYADALDEMQSAGVGWQGTLAGIDKGIQDSIKWYLEAGVGQDKLATVYKLTATQVKAVATALAEEQAALKIEQASVLQTTKLWDEDYALKSTRGGTTADKQTADIWRAFNDETAALKLSDANYVQHYDALLAVAQEKLAAIGTDWDALGEHSTRALQQTADKAAATYNAALAQQGQFSDAYLEELRRAAEQTQQEAWGIQESEKAIAAGATTSAGTVRSEYVAAFQKAGEAALTFDQEVQRVLNRTAQNKAFFQSGVPYAPGAVASQLNQMSARNVGLSIPQFQSGGAGDFGPGTLAMLHGKEAIVPWDKIGDRMTGAQITAPINIMVGRGGDAAAAGREAADALLARLQQRGVRI